MTKNSNRLGVGAGCSTALACSTKLCVQPTALDTKLPALCRVTGSPREEHMALGTLISTQNRPKRQIHSHCVLRKETKLLETQQYTIIEHRELSKESKPLSTPGGKQPTLF